MFFCTATRAGWYYHYIYIYIYIYIHSRQIFLTTKNYLANVKMSPLFVAYYFLISRARMFFFLFFFFVLFFVFWDSLRRPLFFYRSCAQYASMLLHDIQLLKDVSLPKILVRLSPDFTSFTGSVASRVQESSFLWLANNCIMVRPIFCCIFVSHPPPICFF